MKALVGINAIALAVPRGYVDLSDLAEARGYPRGDVGADKRPAPKDAARSGAGRGAAFLGIDEGERRVYGG